MMNIALTDDLQRLLKKKVENGQYPDEQAVVEQALRRFLVEEPDQGQPQMNSTPEPEKEDDEEARPWRGVYALVFPEEVLFTKSIDIRPEVYKASHHSAMAVKRGRSGVSRADG